MNNNISFALDYQLKDLFNELKKYVNESKYYNSTDKDLKKIYIKRTDGIVIGSEIGTTGINLLEANSRKVQKITKNDYPITCPLCLNPQIDKNITPYNKNKGLLWRNFLIQPNSFPYLKVHFLIQSTDHNQELDRGTQSEVHKNIFVIKDIFDFIKINNKGIILFNGYVGNSLTHLHFHYTETKFPIKEQIKKYTFNKDIIVTKNRSRIQLFKDHKNNCKNFILIKGYDPSSDIFNILQYLDSNKLFYNLTIYYKEDLFYTYIFIRQKTKDENNFNFGASNLSGLSLTSAEHKQLSKTNVREFINMIDTYCTESVVKFDMNILKKIFK
jgi:diadenosine tetraphosphate (Ap4A) HIT family hydrolase